MSIENYNIIYLIIIYIRIFILYFYIYYLSIFIEDLKIKYALKSN